ncbi:hypothetical protein OU798_00930 [Prolixibacteraceae bacterium Z1-6]|uniref:Uncharacterized protein n=1 Tax=Draconibacterium aestuarii TaxID=2998507 RepID=A0A9X3F1L0_9BACT|nr:hypothetical protein [Prolixibacteraceae bacterium Z1-6]
MKGAIKKILEVDYPRGRAKGYYANFISAKTLKTEFSLFYPSVSLKGCHLPSTGEKKRNPEAKPRGIIQIKKFFRISPEPFIKNRRFNRR